MRQRGAGFVWLLWALRVKRGVQVGIEALEGWLFFCFLRTVCDKSGARFDVEMLEGLWMPLTACRKDFLLTYVGAGL